MKLRVFAVVCAVIVVLAAAGLAGEHPGRYVSGVFVPDGGSAGNYPAGSVADDTIYSFPDHATWTGGLAWDGQHFWVTDLTSSSIFELDTTGQLLDSLPARGGGSGDLEWVNGRLWEVAEDEARLYELDTSTGSPIRSFRLPDSASGDPNSWGLSWDGANFWHSQYGGERIYELDTVSGQVLFSFTPHTSLMLGIAWDGSHLWGADLGTLMLYEMNPADSSVVDSFPNLVPYPLGLKWVGPNLWNASGSTNRVYKLGGLNALAEPAKPGSENPFGMASPNPFAGQTLIRWAGLKGAGRELLVFDALGRMVRTLAAGQPASGGQSAVWNGRDNAGNDLPCGAYFARPVGGGPRAVLRLVKVP